MRRLTVIVTVALLAAGAALLIQRGRATAYAPANHRCQSVPWLGGGFKPVNAIRILTQGVSCTTALGIVRTRVSDIGVTFVGNPEGPASQFRWKLDGYPGWTCYGDGSGFPEGGAGGDCSKGGSTVEWYHSN